MCRCWCPNKVKCVCMCLLLVCASQSHEPERLHFADVSPLLRAAMADAGSAGARRLLTQGAHDKWAREKAVQRGKAGAKGGARGVDEGEEDAWQGWLGSSTQGPFKTQLTAKHREELFKFVQDKLQEPPPACLG